MIADIGLTRRNAEGLIAATAKVVILRPAGGRNPTLLLKLSNRGRALMPMLFNDAFEPLARRLEPRPNRSPAALRLVAVIHAIAAAALKRSFNRACPRGSSG